jgi:NCS1 family nucleobase:cation symporter-1
MKLATEDVHLALIDDGVPVRLQVMTPEKVFWSHLGTNLAPAAWVLGAIVGGIGLDVRAALVAIVLGNVLGSLPVALCATLGPRTRLTQIENSRFSFGRLGTRLPALLNWLGAVGWDAVNNVPSTLALIALFAMLHLAVPFWGGLLLLSSIQLTAGMYGHHVVQIVGKYLGYVLVVIFAVAGGIAVATGGSLHSAHSVFTVPLFVLAISLPAGFTIGFAPYSSDYTRYLPAHTPPRKIFALAFFGVGSSGLVLEIIGLLTASKLADLSPMGVIGGIAHLCGSFAPFALVAIAASAFVVNSINDNTAAYSLISAGIRLPRHVAAFITATCGFALAVVGAGAFAQLFSNYMLVLLYWIAPWAGIVLAHWFLLRDQADAPAGWAPGASVFAIVTALTIGLFSATDIYTGPVARWLGGTDIGYFVGFFAAAGAYLLVTRSKLMGARGRTRLTQGRIA